MGLFGGALPLFFAFFCLVQCQWDQIVNQDENLIDPKGLRTLNQGRSPYKDERTAQLLPHMGVESSRSRRRTRRQSLYTRSINTVDEPFTWNHRFTIEESQPNSLTKETAYIWQDTTKRLKHVMEKETVFQFLNPTGLRISIPANSLNMRIVDYRVKLNDEFRGNDGGHFALNNYKRNGMWVYEVPQLKLKQGDRVHYWMRLVLSKEGFNVIVKGVLEVTRGNPHITPYMEAIPFRPTAPVLAPQPLNYNSGLSPTLGGGTREPFVWNHQFTINATYKNAFTKESASSWLQHAEFIKRFLQKNVDFKFQNPRGLIISIPDDNINILDFRIKLNDEFRENDVGHFAPTTYKRDNMWTYYIPELHVQQGDRVYYWMRITRNKDGFDAIVRGLLEINQGNPHSESSFNAVGTTSAPYQYPQTHVVNSQPPIRQPIQQSIGNGQPSIGVNRPSIGANQPSIGNGQSPYGGGEPELFDRFGGSDTDDNGGQAFNWEHKFTSINLNSTPEADISPETANWVQKADDYFKKALERDIKFQFLNPSGLKILLSGEDNNFQILAFNIKLNEEFKTLNAGHFLANVTRTNDGRWSYFYQNLKLKQGDKVYYWMKNTFGKDMWLYIVKGILEITLGDPHKNTIRTTTPPPRPTYAVEAPVAANTPVRWDHKYSVNKTNNDGYSNIKPEDEQILKNMFRNDIAFKFLNPSGLSILFSGEDKDLRVLALNIKLNEDFRTLGSGHYVANVTVTRDNKLNYYYPNLKVKQGDTVYYWMRVMVGKERNDYIVKGELRLKDGDPHFGGPVPDVPPPVIWTQAQPRPTPPSVYNQSPGVVQANNQAAVQAPATTVAPFNEPLNRVYTQSPFSQNQNPQPVPLTLNPPSSGGSAPTRICASQSAPNAQGTTECQEEVVVDYHFNKMDGTHQFIIGAKSPIQLNLGVQVDKNTNSDTAGS